MKQLFTFLALLNFCTISFAAQVVRGPYIEDPTQSTSVLRWQTDAITPSWLEYGPAPRCNQITTVTPQSTQHKVVLYGLVPNQEYCYKLYVYNKAQDGTQEPIKGSFRTLFSPERKIVNFVVIGNTSNEQNENYLVEENPEKQQLANLIAKENADFMIHTGNITHSGLNSDANTEFFDPFSDVLVKTPLFVALGANEYGPDRSSRDSKSFLRTNYARFHDMTWSKATPKYYSFDSANARFIVLDTNILNDAVWAPEIGEKSEQAEWLKTTLAGATEKWKIVVVNGPVYSTGSNGGNFDSMTNLVTLFENYGVNLVLQGGDKNYERSFPIFRGEIKPRGVTYVTIGTSSLPPTKREHPQDTTARFVSARHYASCKIVDHKLTLKVFSEKGKQLDQLELYLK